MIYTEFTAKGSTKRRFRQGKDIGHKALQISRDLFNGHEIRQIEIVWERP